MEKLTYTRQKKRLNYVFLIVVLITLSFVTLSGCLIYNSFCSNSDRGSFGDMFGLTSSVFSGLAFAGIIYTILLQRIELELQRDEIAKSTSELAGQRAALDRQNFENKFFQLINLHHQIVNEIHENWQHARVPFYNDKREIFGNAVTRIHEYYNNPIQYREFHGIDRLVKIYQLEVYNKHRAVFGHYFRNLFHIVKFVAETKELDLIERKEDTNVRYNYMKILRAQLSSYEILLLAYNGLTLFGGPFRENINKYRLLKNMDFDGYVVEIEALFVYYPHLKEAYDAIQNQLKHPLDSI
jgi:hypothetical protein